MNEKELLTNTEIEIDIKTALKYPADIEESLCKKIDYLSVLIVLILLIIALIRLEIFFSVFLGIFLYAILCFILSPIILKFKTHRVKIDDYAIKNEIVYGLREEHFTSREGKHRRPVHNYIIRFENGKSWRIPKDNYLWRDDCPMFDSLVYKEVNRGDTMIVVTKKKNGKVVMAYSTKIFQYKDG